MSFAGLERLNAEIAGADPHDSHAQMVIFERIVQLRNEMERAHASDLAAYLDSAACLTDYLVQIGGMTPEDVKDIVSRLVKKVTGAFENPSLDSGAVSAQPPAPELSPEQVQEMIDKQVDQDLLGEIMVQMHLVTRKNLDRALVTQRATDMRIGEALISIQACTWEQVNQGMSAQQQMRSRLKLH